jgi:hypothetical protein
MQQQKLTQEELLKRNVAG